MKVLLLGPVGASRLPSLLEPTVDLKVYSFGLAFIDVRTMYMQALTALFRFKLKRLCCFSNEVRDWMLGSS